MPQPDTSARACKALAHPRRVRIFQLLARDPGAGASCLTLRRALRMPETSLGHHLEVMEACGLLRRSRQGSVVTITLTTLPLTSAFRAILQTAETARGHLRSVA